MSLLGLKSRCCLGCILSRGSSGNFSFRNCSYSLAHGPLLQLQSPSFQPLLPLSYLLFLSLTILFWFLCFFFFLCFFNKDHCDHSGPTQMIWGGGILEDNLPIILKLVTFAKSLLVCKVTC